MDDKIAEEQRAVDALKRAVSHDLSIVAQLDYATAASSIKQPNTFTEKRLISRLIVTAGIAVFIGAGTFMSSRILFPAPETLVSDYDTEVRMLIDEIHIDNHSFLNLANPE